MSNSIFSSPLINGLVLGAVTAGVAVFGNDAGKALEGVFEGTPETGWQKLANTVLDSVGQGLTTSAKFINDQGSAMSTNISQTLNLDTRVHDAVLPAIAASLAGISLTGLVNAATAEAPMPGGIPAGVQGPNGPGRTA